MRRTIARQVGAMWCVLVIAYLAISPPPVWSQAELTGGDLPSTPASDHPNPAVAAVLAANPSTPSALLRSALLLMDLGETEAARPLLKGILEANLDEDRRVDLWRQFGSPVLLRLAAAASLAPEGRQVASALLEAASARVREPQRVETLIRQLADASAEVRHLARTDLLQAKTAALGPLLTALADPQQAAAHNEIRAVLTAMGPLAADPLLAALQTNDVQLKTHVIRVAGQLGPHAARLVPFLILPAVGSASPEVRAVARQAFLRLRGQLPDRRQAEHLLRTEVQHYLEGTSPLVGDHQGEAALWQWTDGQRRCVLGQRPVREVGVLLAARLAGDLLALDPTRAVYRRLDLACRLESAKILNGFAAPLPRGRGSAFQRGLELGPRGVEDVLDFALAQDQLGAALGAVEILSEIGTQDLVCCQGGPQAPLVRAAAHGDRRLRFEATRAILKLNPSRPYPGSSGVPETLGFLVSSGGARRALVGDPQPGRGQTLASMLTALGYDTQVATSGHQLIESATQSADMEMLLIRMTITQPTVRELFYRLRRDPRTARLPIALIAASENWRRAERMARADPCTELFALPDDDDAMKVLVTRLNRSAGRSVVPLGERHAQAVTALRWLARLSAQPQRLYDITSQIPQVERALWIQPLRPLAIETLVEAGLARSQRALLQLASQGIFRLEDRQLAATAFRQSVARHGILLTSQEIVQQYDRYNASQRADQPTQRLLASILDTLENKYPAEDPTAQ